MRSEVFRFALLRKAFMILFSLKTTLVLLAILGIGAGVATFLENDYGTSTARVLVYYSGWYTVTLLLTTLNLSGVIVRYRMWRHPSRFLFHLAFVVIAAGAAISHFYGQEGIVHIREGMTENRMLSAEPYLQLTIHDGNQTWYQEFGHDFAAIGDNAFRDTVRFGGGRELRAEYVHYAFKKQMRSGMGLLTVKLCLDGECREVKLVGQRGAKGFKKSITFGDTRVEAEFGSKVIRLPFALKLRDFQLERYPGSMAPSSYASEVTVIDGESRFDYRIYMNHTLDYKKYKFFQSSYDQDEKGTILSVNNDPGKWPTYIGYILLTLGLLGNLFDRSSRFGKLVRFIRQSAPAVVLMVWMAQPIYAAQPGDFEKYLSTYTAGSAPTAHRFGELITQSPMGRMEPVNSLDTQLLYKLHGSLTFRWLDQDQVLLGMLSHPELWRYAKLIKVRSPKLKQVLGLDPSARYAAFADAFAGKNRYKLKTHVEQANRTDPNKRGTFEREVITLDEKLNIIYMTFYGNLFHIYPLPNDPRNSWYNPLEAMEKFGGSFQKQVEGMTHDFIDATAAGNWSEADKAIGRIAAYQQRYGAGLLPDRSRIKAELFYNRLHLFPRLVAIYMLLGLVLLVLGFIEVIARRGDRPFFVWTRRIATAVLVVLFLAHTFGLGLRWYIAGHAPWSDAYESLLYISWSAMLAGVLFFRRSLLVLAATVIIAGIFMFTAHLSNINPQITTLVPVLKSYWLTIHVSVITASYGFLGLGAVLGYITLLLFLLRHPDRSHIDAAIYRLSAVNEAALILGLSLLTVGNFIGGVWANESWGRYWGWDPKETWAYVTIVAYTFILHLRLIPRLDRPWVFAVASFLVFSTVLMTYFGVNFYLSGMHSYATGDPVPIPTWVYYLMGLAAVTIAATWPKRGLKRLRVKRE